MYGRFNSTFVGGGGVCVKPWKDGANNGGATSPGVTKDSITVVAMVPNEEQINSPGGTAPVNRNGNTRGNYQDAVHDYLLPLMKYYETWGRDIKVMILTSSGNDETAQRADVVAAKADTPFAVVNFVPAGLDVFDAEMAKAKILVFGYATTADEGARAGAVPVGPHRLAGDCRQLRRSARQAARREEGAVRRRRREDSNPEHSARCTWTAPSTSQRSRPACRSITRRLAADASYLANGSPRGDTTTAQEQAPVIVTKLKQAGVTTVVLFTDVAMTGALMENATKQEWSPEWFFTGTVFQDLALLAARIPSSSRRTRSGSPACRPGCSPTPRPRRRRSR